MRHIVQGRSARVDGNGTATPANQRRSNFEPAKQSWAVHAFDTTHLYRGKVLVARAPCLVPSVPSGPIITQPITLNA